MVELSTILTVLGIGLGTVSVLGGAYILNKLGISIFDFFKFFFNLVVNSMKWLIGTISSNFKIYDEKAMFFLSVIFFFMLILFIGLLGGAGIGVMGVEGKTRGHGAGDGYYELFIGGLQVGSDYSVESTSQLGHGGEFKDGETPTCWGDTDCDGIPDGADDDIDGDGLANNEDPDIDGDGVENENDVRPCGDYIDCPPEMKSQTNLCPNGRCDNLTTSARIYSDYVYDIPSYCAWNYRRIGQIERRNLQANINMFCYIQYKYIAGFVIESLIYFESPGTCPADCAPPTNETFAVDNRTCTLHIDCETEYCCPDTSGVCAGYCVSDYCAVCTHYTDPSDLDSCDEWSYTSCGYMCNNGNCITRMDQVVLISPKNNTVQNETTIQFDWM